MAIVENMVIMAIRGGRTTPWASHRMAPERRGKGLSGGEGHGGQTRGLTGQLN
jgi:hypothetical protein